MFRVVVLYLTLFQCFSFKQFIYKSIYTNNRYTKESKLYADVNEIAQQLTLQDFADKGIGSSINFDDLQSIAVLIAAGCYFIYEKRPRGSAVVELVEVRKSTVPSANLGLFCKSFIPKGASLGFYPGVLTQAEFALKRSKIYVSL